MAINFINEGRLKFYSSVSRESIPSILLNHDYLIYVCNEAIDKVILKATILKAPVVTVNTEYLKEFEFWTDHIATSDLSLDFELESLLRTSED